MEREYDIDVETLKKDNVDQETIDVIQDAIDETFKDFNPDEGITPEMEAETERIMAIEDLDERMKELKKVNPNFGKLDDSKHFEWIDRLTDD